MPPCSLAPGRHVHRKRAGGRAPAATPFTLFARANTQELRSWVSLGQDIFVPRASANPVILRLREMSLYKQESARGTHDITCPWVSEHTDQLDNGAAYFEPTVAYPRGGFRCHHSHGDRYRIGELIDFLQLSPAEARNRARIRLVAGDLNSVIHAAEAALAECGHLYQSGGAIVAVRSDPQSKIIRVEAVTEQALTQLLAATVDWERYDGRSKEWVRCDPPARIVTLLHKAQSYSALPTLSGLARQPFFREEDGELVSRSGYDLVSRKLASFDNHEFNLGDTSFAGAREALGRLERLLEEFHFASDTDRSAALAAMLTAAVRPTLPVAPAFNVTASGIGSGKTYPLLDDHSIRRSRRPPNHYLSTHL